MWTAAGIAAGLIVLLALARWLLVRWARARQMEVDEWREMLATHKRNRRA